MVAVIRERGIHYEHFEFYGWMGGPARVAHDHRARSDCNRNDAVHSEAQRCREICRSNTWHSDRADARPKYHHERLVGNTFVATGHTHCNWNIHLASAAAPTAITKEGTGMIFRAMAIQHITRYIHLDNT